MVVADLRQIMSVLLDDEPKAATTTWWQCTQITREVHKRRQLFWYVTLKLENEGEHSTPREMLTKTTRME